MPTTQSLPQQTANAPAPPISRRPPFPIALLLTSLLTGTLDATGATISFLLKGNHGPEKIWRFVASGVFGKPALSGGADMVIYGLFFHFFIAFMCTLVFFLLYPRIPALARHKYLAAIGCALVAWVVTNLVIVPLSHAPHGPIHLDQALIGFGVLILAIGLPISLLAHRWLR
jgi:hypothetical protein